MPAYQRVANSVDGLVRVFDVITNTLNVLPEPYIEDLCKGQCVLIIYPYLDQRITVLNPSTDDEIVSFADLTVRLYSSERDGPPYFPRFPNEVDLVQAWRDATDNPLIDNPLILWQSISANAVVTKVLDISLFQDTSQNTEENEQVQGAMAIAGAHGDLDAMRAMLEDEEGYHDDEMDARFDNLRTFLNSLGHVEENEGAQGALTALNAISRWYRDTDGEEQMPEEVGLQHLQIIREFINLHMVDSMPTHYVLRQALQALQHLTEWGVEQEPNLVDSDYTRFVGYLQMIKPGLELMTEELQIAQPSPLAVVQDLDALLDLFRNDAEFDKQSLIDVLTNARRALQLPAVREVETARRNSEQPPGVQQAMVALTQIGDLLAHEGFFGAENERKFNIVRNLLRYWQTAIDQDVRNGANHAQDQQRQGFREVISALERAGFEVTPLAGERNS